MILNIVFGIWIFLLFTTYNAFWKYLGLADQKKATRIKDKIASDYFKKIYLIMIPITILAIISKFT